MKSKSLKIAIVFGAFLFHYLFWQILLWPLTT